MAAIYRAAGFDAIVTDNIFEAGCGLLLTLAYSSLPGAPIAAVTVTPEHLLAAVDRTLKLGLRLDTSDQTGERVRGVLRGDPGGPYVRSDAYPRTHLLFALHCSVCCTVPNLTALASP